MESWCFDSLDSGYASNEILTQSGSIIRSKDVLMGWDFKLPSSDENSMFVHSQQSVENSVFPDVGLSEIIRKQCHNDSPKNVFYNEGTVGDIVSPSIVISNPMFGEEESSSVVDSNSRELSQIDLKLGVVGDSLNPSASRVAPSSSESSTRVKRTRGFSFQTVYCQVLGCNKDLSSAKDYHKRHKVCDAHSKTSRVIVNGIEQRFCQQCSRFHLLGEFDDGKRSCRKRLAGHNERRRKPQVGYNNGRAGRSFSYSGSAGSKFQGTTLTPTSISFTYQDILPRGTSHAEKYGLNGWDAHVKIEDHEADYSHKSSNIFINGHLHENKVLSPFVEGKQYCSIDNISDDKLRENMTQIPHEKVTHSSLTFNAASTAQGLPGTSESGCALSLLSSQSQNSSDHPSGIPGSHNLVIPNRNPHYNVTEVSEKLLGVGAWDLTSRVQNRSIMGNKNESSMSVPRNVNDNGILQGSEFANANDCLSYEEGATVNLLQLSSQLQRVENQRQTATSKQGTESFWCLRMT